MNREQKFYWICKKCRKGTAYKNADEIEEKARSAEGKRCPICESRMKLYGEDLKTEYSMRGGVVCEYVDLHKTVINYRGNKDFDTSTIEFQIGSKVVLNNGMSGYIVSHEEGTRVYKIRISDSLIVDDITEKDFENHFARFMNIDNYSFGNYITGKERTQMYKEYEEIKEQTLLLKVKLENTTDEEEREEIKQEIKRYEGLWNKYKNGLIRVKKAIAKDKEGN